MTVQQAETILLPLGIKIALQHRFAGDKGTILRLDNYAMINIFDDGRYYIQGEDIDVLVAVFSEHEEPWDPDSWTGEVPEPLLPWFPPRSTPPKRFDI
jgi:hypothetical protein